MVTSRGHQDINDSDNNDDDYDNNNNNNKNYNDKTRTTMTTRVTQLWDLIETRGFRENIKDISNPLYVPVQLIIDLI